MRVPLAEREGYKLIGVYLLQLNGPCLVSLPASAKGREEGGISLPMYVLLAGLVLHRHGDSLFVRPDTYAALLYPVPGTTGSRVVSSMLMGHIATASGGRNRVEWCHPEFACRNPGWQRHARHGSQ